MRHADFLILSKDYKALEAEANAMKQLDKVNPRILRYLGYAAFENGNTDDAIAALNDFITKGNNKVIARDYLVLGQAKIKKSIGTDGKTIDEVAAQLGLAEVKKAVEMEPLMANELNELGKKYFSQKFYNLASAVFEIAITVPTSPNALEDNVYYGLSVYSVNRNLEEALRNKIQIANADKAIDTAIAQKPDYQESYLYKARLNNLINNDEVMAASYQKYTELVTAKGDEEITKNKTKLIESYNNSAAYYASKKELVTSKELLSKTLALDPANAFAIESMKTLK